MKELSITQIDSYQYFLLLIYLMQKTIIPKIKAPQKHKALNFIPFSQINPHTKHLYQIHKTSFLSNLYHIQLDNILLNTTNIKKIKILNKTMMKIHQIFQNEELLDRDQYDDSSNYQEDINRQFNQREISLNCLIQELIQIYNLQSLLPLLQLLPSLDCIDDKPISIKNQLSRFYSIQLASKIHIQLDLLCLQIWFKLSPAQIQKINICQEQMWGDDYMIISIIQEYYEQILNTHLQK